jgi:drug/metabolite transporter (DMT)-like permease
VGSVDGRVAAAARPSRAEAVAPIAFVLLWSTGFVVARYATRDAAPLTFLTIRLAIAAGLLALVAKLLRAPRPTALQVRWSAVAGIGLHALYLGGVFVAIDRGMPAGVSALIAGLHPVLTSLLATRLLGERLKRVQWIGVGLGFVGVAVVVVDRLLAQSQGVTTFALVASAISIVGMSAGTLVQRRNGASTPLLWGTVVQFAASAAVLAVPALVWEGFVIEPTLQVSFAMAWSVLVMSIVAILMMLWLLQRQAAARVSSLFFLTPALSALEAAILFDERLGAAAIVGLVIGLAGVALVTRSR